MKYSTLHAQTTGAVVGIARRHFRIGQCVGLGVLTATSLRRGYGGDAEERREAGGPLSSSPTWEQLCPGRSIECHVA